jgi:hypothetical protein
LVSIKIGLYSRVNTRKPRRNYLRTLHSSSVSCIASCSRLKDSLAFLLHASVPPSPSISPQLALWRHRSPNPMDVTDLSHVAGVVAPPQQPSLAVGFGSGSPAVRSVAHMITGAGKPKRKRLGNTSGSLVTSASLAPKTRQHAPVAKAPKHVPKKSNQVADEPQLVAL